jgi:hypothetical protein
MIIRGCLSPGYLIYFTLKWISGISLRAFGNGTIITYSHSLKEYNHFWMDFKINREGEKE